MGWQFTPGLFAMLGTPPAMGRTFTPEDGAAGRDDLVVLSDGLWRRRFDARPMWSVRQSNSMGGPTRSPA